MNMFKCSYNFPENVDKNMKLWTNLLSLLMNIQVNHKCSYNFPENVDKNMKLLTNISILLMNIHEHSSEPKNCGQLFFKFGQYCPHFLENSMNILVYL
jgi:hypothetical protein